MVATDTGEIVLEALRTRRMMPRVRPERPPRELVERVIQAAAWAPNHYKTQPWRFIVLAGEAREELGNVMEAALRAQLDDPGSADAIALLERERRKPLRAPVVIVVAIVPSDQPKVLPIEELAAGAAAVENMLLAAQALGLGAMWRTGTPAYDPRVKQFLGIPDHGYLLAFVYLGYPDPLPVPERDRRAARHTSWRGWEDGA
jgi:nitroreductase